MLGLENVVMGFSDDHEECFPHGLHFNLMEIMWKTLTLSESAVILKPNFLIFSVILSTHLLEWGFSDLKAGVVEEVGEGYHW